MAATQEWHYAKDNQQFGPVTAAELKRLASTGELSASDLVWKEGMADWKFAKTIKGLFTESQPHLSASVRETSASVSTATKRRFTEGRTAGTSHADVASTAQQVKRPFWQRLSLAAVLTVLCWPIGLLLIWINPKLSRQAKFAWTGATFAAFLMLLVIGSRIPDSASEKKNNLGDRPKSSRQKNGMSVHDSLSEPTDQGEEIDETLFAAATSRRGNESSHLVRSLSKPSSVVEASFSGPSMLLTPNGEFLFNGRDLLHVPSAKWVAYRTTSQSCIAPTTREVASIDFNHEVKTNQQQLSLFKLEGASLSKKTTLNLADVSFPHGYHYLSPQFSPDGEYIIVEIGQGNIYGFTIFKASPQLKEVARIDSPKQGGGEGNHRPVYSVSGNTGGVWIENFRMSRTHVVVPFSDLICVYELATGALTASWEIEDGLLLGFASDDGAIAAVTGKYDAKVVEILGPEKASRRSLLKLEHDGESRRVVTIRPEQDEILLASSKSRLEYVSLKDGKVKRSTTVPRYYKSGDPFAVVSQDRQHAVFLEHDGNLHVWSLQDAKPIAYLGPTEADLSLNMTIANGGKLVATVHPKSNQVGIWKVDEGVLAPARPVAVMKESAGESTSRGATYFTVTDIEKSQGWSIPDRGHEQNAPAPPVSPTSYKALQEGMNAFEVAALLGGWAHKAKVESGRDGPTWWFRLTQVYVGETSGSIVVLLFEQDARTGHDILVKKMSRGL